MLTVPLLQSAFAVAASPLAVVRKTRPAGAERAALAVPSAAVAWVHTALVVVLLVAASVVSSGHTAVAVHIAVVGTADKCRQDGYPSHRR